jgi:CLIP-associating protein 1/2
VLFVFFIPFCQVLEGTNTIRDALTCKADPVYGLTTMHASLRLFYSEAPPTPEDEEIKAATYAFGLMALGKFILRLPAEIAEEEIPRLKGTLITVRPFLYISVILTPLPTFFSLFCIQALNDKSSLIVRESAAASIIAAQLVLRDETHLFTLLDGLADEKKNLLTYLFDKHGAREVGNVDSNGGIDKLEKEIRRLDTRTSTPLRSGI